MKSFIAVDERSQLDQFANRLILRLEESANNLSSEVSEWFKLHPNGEKREFAQWIQNKEHDALYWKFFAREDPRDAVFSYVLKVLHSRKGFDKLKALVNNLNFKDFADPNSSNNKTKFSDWH